MKHRDNFTCYRYIPPKLNLDDSCVLVKEQGDYQHPALLFPFASSLRRHVARFDWELENRPYSNLTSRGCQISTVFHLKPILPTA
jgi:hypothetical protein